MEIKERKFTLQLTKEEYDLITQKRRYTNKNFKKLIDDFLTKTDEAIEITIEIEQWLKNNEDNKEFNTILEKTVNMEFFNDILKFSKKYEQE